MNDLHKLDIKLDDENSEFVKGTSNYYIITKHPKVGPPHPTSLPLTRTCSILVSPSCRTFKPNLNYTHAHTPDAMDLLLKDGIFAVTSIDVEILMYIQIFIFVKTAFILEGIQQSSFIVKKTNKQNKTSILMK